MVQERTPEYYKADEEKRNLVCAQKGISAKIDTKEHSELRAVVIADNFAIYMNPGDEIYVMDIRTKEFLEEQEGLQEYHKLINEIVVHGKEYEYGDRHVENCKYHYKRQKAREARRTIDLEYVLPSDFMEKENYDLLLWLLTAPEDLYGVLRLKEDIPPAPDHLAGADALKRMGITKYNFTMVIPENYDLIFIGPITPHQRQTSGETLESISKDLLSRSDIVVLHQNGQNSAHFVDSFCYTSLPDFVKAMEETKLSKENEKNNQLTEDETLLSQKKNSRGR